MIVKMLAAAAALVAMTAAARADITQNFFIEASDFTLSAGPGGEPPAEPVTASIIVTFDPSKSIDPTTSGLTINATNLPPNTEFAYDATADTLIIATKPTGGVCEVVAGGWCAFIGDGSQAFPFLKSLSAWADNGGEWIPRHATLHIGLAGAVPEPSTWTLTLIGFGGMAWAFRRGRRGARERRRTISQA